MYLCCEMRATSYICVKHIFLHSLLPPSSTESLWIPFPSNINWDVDPEANIPVFHFSKLAEHRSSGGGCCSNTDSSFKAPLEVEFCWTSAWGVCQVEHTELVSHWLCCLPALLPVSKAPGAMVCRKFRSTALLPLLTVGSPLIPLYMVSEEFHSLNCFFFLHVRSQAFGLRSLTDIFFYRKVVYGHRNLNDQIYISPSAKGKNRAQFLA